VIELRPQSPCAGLDLPLECGGVRLKEVAPEQLTAIAPYRGQDRALSAALKAAHGMPAPAPNRTTGDTDARALWFGQRLILLAGPAPDPGLARHAALSDQSDGWATVRLEGAGARDVLARLVPLDLRPVTFACGHTARTDLRHMAASVSRLQETAWQIMVFRGFAGTLVHDLKSAMQAVAARHG